MKCNKCGKDLPNDSEFCQYCGSKIEMLEEITKSVEPAKIYEPSKEDVEKFNSYNPTTSNNYYAKQNNPVPDSRSTKTNKVPIIILSAIIVIVFSLYYNANQKFLNMIDAYDKLESKYEKLESEFDSLEDDAKSYQKIRDFMRKDTNKDSLMYSTGYEVVVIDKDAGMDSFNIKASLGYNVEYYFTVMDTSIIDASWGNWVDSSHLNVRIKPKKTGITKLKFTNSKNSYSFNVLVVIV